MPLKQLLESLSEQEKSYYQLLLSLRTQEFSERELAFVKNIVQFSSSPLLLSTVISCEKWYQNDEIKQALSQNDVLPSDYHSHLRKVLMAIDLFKDLNIAATNEDKKTAISLKIKKLLEELEESDKEFLKRLASRKLPYPPSTEDSIEFEKKVEKNYLTIFRSPLAFSFRTLSAEEKILKAKTSNDSKELKALLFEDNNDIIDLAISNRYLKDNDLLDVLKNCKSGFLLKKTYETPKWFFKQKIRKALLENSALDPVISHNITTSDNILALFDKLGKLKRNITERDNTTQEIVELLKTSNELELQYLTVTIKKKWPELISIIKIYYKFIQDNPVDDSEKDPSLKIDNILEEFDEIELLHIAAKTDKEQHLSLLLRKSDPNIFRNILSNPHLDKKTLKSVIYTLDLKRLIILSNSSRWFSDSLIRSTMIHNINLTEPIAIKIAEQLESFKDLMDVLRDTKVKSVDVKNICFSKLSSQFKALEEIEKARVIIETNGEIFRELWGDIFANESLLETLLLKYDPSEEIVIRIVHSRLTPLSILQLITVKGIHFQNKGIVLEFFNNPKVNGELQEIALSKCSDEMKSILSDRGLI